MREFLIFVYIPFYVCRQFVVVNDFVIGSELNTRMK